MGLSIFGVIQDMPEPYKFPVREADELLEDYFVRCLTNWMNINMLGMRNSDKFRVMMNKEISNLILGWCEENGISGDIPIPLCSKSNHNEIMLTLVDKDFNEFSLDKWIGRK